MEPDRSTRTNAELIADRSKHCLNSIKNTITRPSLPEVVNSIVKRPFKQSLVYFQFTSHRYPLF